MIAVLPGLAEHRFRAGGDYELMAFDRLQPEEQVLLAELRSRPDFYGILRPREGTGRTVQAVDRDTALLWLGAQAAGRLPFFVWESESPSASAHRVTRLVLDGILEIELEGVFVSGARALPLLPERQAEPRGRLRALSAEALRHGAGLRLTEPEELAARLYGFGAVPLSPAWRRRLPSPTEVLGYLGAAPGTALDRRLRSGFSHSDSPDPSGWLAWSRRSRRSPGPDDPMYKLYLSPLPGDLPTAFAAVVEVLLNREDGQFKVGGSAAGVLRPDKLVVYARSREALQQLAEALALGVAGLAPQGVPFSGEIMGDGLLSWGMDPPRSARLLAWQGYDSWRLWLVRRLASAMIAAQRDATEDDAIREFAIQRLRLEGVDVDDWTPPPGAWWQA